jgi:ABC-type dipeptide/oligopeptide/nickel transport system permease component
MGLTQSVVCSTLVVVLVVSMITFLLMHAVPKDLHREIPARKDHQDPDERYHLDDPLYIQYTIFMIFIPFPTS